MRVLPCHRASHRTVMTHPLWRLFPIGLPRHPLHSCASLGPAGFKKPLCVWSAGADGPPILWTSETAVTNGGGRGKNLLLVVPRARGAAC